MGKSLEELWSERLVGQPTAIAAVAPYVEIYEARLAPEGRPAGVFLLMGPTGTGKTRTVETLAGLLHGDERKLLKVDCGEFQMEHEVAKLIGAPPGYLGHRETQPLLTQARLNAMTSETSSLAVVLFDEVEKAASTLVRLLLGVLDKATLRLGDNTAVNFERSLIFLTTNLGARRMMRALEPEFGFESLISRPEASTLRLDRIGLSSARKKFSPEFLNRIDRIISYSPLNEEALQQVLDQQLDELETLIRSRLGPRAFRLALSPAARQFLLERGTNRQYGARELKRTVHRSLLQAIAAIAVAGGIPARASLFADWDGQADQLTLRVKRERPDPLDRSLPLI